MVPLALSNLVYKPCKFIFSSITSVTLGTAKNFLKVLAASSTTLPALCFGAGLLAWRYKVTVFLALCQIGLDIITRSILVPLCYPTHGSRSSVCGSACAVANTLGLDPPVCIDHYLWESASKSPAVLLSRQLRFSKLGLGDLHERFGGLPIAFDKVPADLKEAIVLHETLESSVAEYSREAGILFK